MIYCSYFSIEKEFFSCLNLKGMNTLNNSIISLLEVPVNKKAKVKEIMLDGPIRRRLLDLGLIEDTVIQVLHKSPFGDPIAYLIRGAVIALRSEITKNIFIEIV